MREKWGSITSMGKFTPGFHGSTKHPLILSFFLTVTVFPPLLVAVFLPVCLNIRI